MISAAAVLAEKKQSKLAANMILWEFHQNEQPFFEADIWAPWPNTLGPNYPFLRQTFGPLG